MIEFKCIFCNNILHIIEGDCTARCNHSKYKIEYSIYDNGTDIEIFENNTPIITIETYTDYTGSFRDSEERITLNITSINRLRIPLINIDMSLEDLIIKLNKYKVFS